MRTVRSPDRHRRRVAGVALGLVVALVATACGGPADDAADRRADGTSPITAAPTTAAPGAAPTTTPAGGGSGPDGPAVPAVLDFTAPDVRGGTVAGADYAGSELVVWFWAPW